jgi:hypothetical protein
MKKFIRFYFDVLICLALAWLVVYHDEQDTPKISSFFSRDFLHIGGKKNSRFMLLEKRKFRDFASVL